MNEHARLYFVGFDLTSSLAGYKVMPSEFDDICKNTLMPQCLYKKNNALEPTLDIAWGASYFIQDSRLHGFTRTEDTILNDLSIKEGIRSIGQTWNQLVIITQSGKCYVYDTRNKFLKEVVCAHQNAAKFKNISAGDTNVIVVLESDFAGSIDFEASPPTFKQFAHEVKMKQISCGKEHVLLLSQIGVVYSMGIGSRGQLGNDDVENRPEPQIIEALEPVRILRISAGGWHSAAISDIGDIYVWGWNESGQLGLGCQNISNTISGNVNVLCTPRVLDIDTSDGPEARVCDVSCGSRHSVLLTDEGKVYSTGWNKYGQLGHGDTESRDSFTEIKAFKKKSQKVREIYCAVWTSVFEIDSIAESDVT